MAEPEPLHWGKSDDDATPELPVDEWFPSEATRSDISPGTSRALIPVMLLIGSVLTAAGIAVMLALRASIFPGLWLTSWGLAYLLAWGPLTYYSIKRWIMRSREARGLRVSQSSKELDAYLVPMRGTWGGVMFGNIQTGSASPTPAIKIIQVIAVVNYVVFLGSLLGSLVTLAPR